MAKRSKQSKRQSAAPVVPARRSPIRVAALALGAVACLLYLPSWHHGFVGDDSMVISTNAWTVEGLSALGRQVTHSLYFGAVPQNSDLYRPVAGVYFTVVGALVGLSPSGYHVANILLYGLNVAAVFVFLAALRPSSLALPVVATLFFVVHPIHTEVVNNIKSADEMLCLLFLLTTGIAWLTYADSPQTRWRTLALVAYALAVGSKETAVPMVVALPALWYVFRGRTARASLVAAVPFFAIAVGFVGLRQLVLSREPTASIVTILNNALLATNDAGTRLATELGYLARYAQMLVWPHPLSFDYTYDAVPLSSFGNFRVWLGIVLCLGLGVAIAIGLPRRRNEGFTALWLVASMILVSNLLFLVSTNFGERLLYIPSVMVCYVAPAWLLRLARVPEDRTVAGSLRSPFVATACVAVLCTGGLATGERSADWQDELTLFTADIAKYPNSARLNDFLGNMYYFAGDRLMAAQGDPAAAAADFDKAKTYLLRGLQINGQFLDLHAVLGMAEFQLKQCSQAIPHLQQALGFKDYRTKALEMTAECYDDQQMPARALEIYKQIDAEGIAYPRGWFQLGNAAAARGDDDASIRYFKQVVAAVPDNVPAYVNLALGENRRGDYAGSLATAEECLARQPDQGRCLLVAADDLMRTGQRDKAMAYYDKAKRLVK